MVVTSEALEPGSMLVSRGRRESLSGVVRKALLLNLAMVSPAPNRADRSVTSGAGRSRDRCYRPRRLGFVADAGGTE